MLVVPVATSIVVLFATGFVAMGATRVWFGRSSRLRESLMKLQLVSIGKDGVVRVAARGSMIAGEFDGTGENPLQQILGPNWAQMRVILNMEDCTFIDSSAVGWLIASQKAFRTAGGQFVVHGVQPSVRQVIDLLKVGRVVQIVDSEEAAKAVLSGGAA